MGSTETRTDYPKSAKGVKLSWHFDFVSDPFKTFEVQRDKTRDLLLLQTSEHVAIHYSGNRKLTQEPGPRS